MPKRAVARARIGPEQLEDSEIIDALTLMLIFAAAVWASWIPFLVLGHDPLDALFEVVSAMGTVGLSTGVSSPSLHPFLKGVLCVDMLLGRLEILVWLVMLSPRTWFGRRMEE